MLQAGKDGSCKSPKPFLQPAYLPQKNIFPHQLS
jgi:hypothetical protein